MCKLQTPIVSRDFHRELYEFAVNWKPVHIRRDEWLPDFGCPCGGMFFVNINHVPVPYYETHAPDCYWVFGEGRKWASILIKWERRSPNTLVYFIEFRFDLDRKIRLPLAISDG